MRERDKQQYVPVAAASERDRSVIEGSYCIILYIKLDQIDVLAVLHGARNVLR